MNIFARAAILAVLLLSRVAFGNAVTDTMPPEGGREWQVAKTGHDTGTGDKDDPFLTIARAARDAQPGDTVVIHAGTYREQVKLPRGGTGENARISFTAAPGEMVVIKGSEPLTAWQSEGSNIWRADVNNTEFGDFNPFETPVGGPGFSGDGWHHLGEVYLDGIAFAEQPTRQAVDAGAGRWFAQRDDRQTHIWANFGVADPRQKLVEINTRSGAFSPATLGVNCITLDGLSIAQTAGNWASLDGSQPGAISTGGGAHWIIQNCTITDAKCVGISLEQPGRDLTRIGPNRPAFGEFHDISAVGHHIIRNNLIQHCGQAGIFGLLHGTSSEIYGNQIEDINSSGQFSGDDVGGMRLAVAIDTIIRGNLIRRVRGAGYGIVLGPLYQGVRITGNVIMNTAGSPFYFIRSHGPALVDNNVIIGPGAASGEGVKLRSAEANVFALNLFDGCAFTSESLPALEAGGTISYLPHTLVTKQTIPALALDNKWYANIFLHGGLEKLPQEHGDEADYNGYMAGATECPWGDTHSRTVAEDGDFALTSTETAVDVTFDLNARPPVKAPVIDADFVGRFALTEGIEQPSGEPIRLLTDFFGLPEVRVPRGIGPFARYPAQNATGARLFERQSRTEVGASIPTKP